MTAGSDFYLHSRLTKKERKEEISKATKSITGLRDSLDALGFGRTGGSIPLRQLLDHTVIPGIKNELAFIDGLAALPRPKAQGLEKGIYAYTLVGAFKGNFGTPLKSITAKIIEIIFNDPTFDKNKLEEITRPLTKIRKL